MIWVDASVWLEVALDQSRANECQDFLDTSKEDLVMSDFDVYSIILTMLKYKKTPDDIRTFVRVLSRKDLTILRPTMSTLVDAVSQMKPLRLTFDDALTYICMKGLGAKQIATLDADFKKVDVEIVF